MILTDKMNRLKKKKTIPLLEQDVMSSAINTESLGQMVIGYNLTIPSQTDKL